MRPVKKKSKIYKKKTDGILPYENKSMNNSDDE